MIMALPFLNILLVTGGMPLAPVMIAGLAVCVFLEIRETAKDAEGLPAAAAGCQPAVAQEPA